MNNKKLYNYIDSYGGNSNTINIENLDKMLDFESSDVEDNTEDYTSSLLDKILSNDLTNDNMHGGLKFVSMLVKNGAKIAKNGAKIAKKSVEAAEFVESARESAQTIQKSARESAQTIQKSAQTVKESVDTKIATCNCCINNDKIIKQIDDIINILKPFID